MPPPSDKHQHTFKTGVTDFWKWYPTVSSCFRDAIESNDTEVLTSVTVEAMDRLMPNMAWTFGPGDNGRHAFTVSGEGYVPKQLLADCWLKQAIEIPGWDFYASRQAASREDFTGLSIEVEGHPPVDAESFRLVTSVDSDEKVVNIVAWHPSLEHVPAEHRAHFLFLLLDEGLGEFGTQTSLGQIDIRPIDDNEQSRSLNELPKFIRGVNNYHKWIKPPPTETHTVYQLSEQSDGPRCDTIVGASVIPGVVFDFIEQGGQLSEDPLAGTGAELAYLSFESDILPEDSQTEARSEIEDALSIALMNESSGRTLGGAFGAQQTYVDLLLLDGQNSRDIVNRTINNLNLQSHARIMPFA